MGAFCLPRNCQFAQKLIKVHYCILPKQFKLSAQWFVGMGIHFTLPIKQGFVVGLASNLNLLTTGLLKDCLKN